MPSLPICEWRIAATSPLRAPVSNSIRRISPSVPVLPATCQTRRSPSSLRIRSRAVSSVGDMPRTMGEVNLLPPPNLIPAHNSAQDRKHPVGGDWGSICDFGQVVGNLIACDAVNGAALPPRHEARVNRALISVACARLPASCVLFESTFRGKFCLRASFSKPWCSSSFCCVACEASTARLSSRGSIPSWHCSSVLTAHSRAAARVLIWARAG